jgi:hypothetical protein
LRSLVSALIVFSHTWAFSIEFLPKILVMADRKRKSPWLEKGTSTALQKTSLSFVVDVEEMSAQQTPPAPSSSSSFSSLPVAANAKGEEGISMDPFQEFGHEKSESDDLEESLQSLQEAIPVTPSTSSVPKEEYLYKYDGKLPFPFEYEIQWLVTGIEFKVSQLY